MPVKTPNFKLDYFKQGSYYSALSDLRRFVTLDYNMESYIGIAGIGVISGWTIETVSGTTIQIIPGNGIISGYFAESPYTVKQRSDMVPGDREIEVLNEDDIPEDPLIPLQRAAYVSVIKLYNPSFNPVGDIENSYVKVVVPTQFTLSNNSDTYVYARRPINAKPYPILGDYPPPAGNPPVRSDYGDYDAYEAARIAYEAKLEALHNYEWYSNPDNHFTSVEFLVSGRYIENNSMVFLGRIVTRSSSIIKIDVSRVNHLANFESEIKKFATEYLVAHHHGGNLPFDPPKVRLETNIRGTALYKYDSESGQAIYSVLDREETTIALGHKHTYQIDSDGNGQTIDQIGSTNPHFHKISSFVVGNPEYTIEYVAQHIHSVPSTFSTAYVWKEGDPFVIYVNGDIFGDETTPYIHADSERKRITFDKGVSASNNKYFCTFDITLVNPFNGSLEEKQYTYENRSSSIYFFMLSMTLDYYKQFAIYYDEQTEDVGEETSISNIGFIIKNLESSPFVSYNSDGSIIGLDDLKSQCSAAQVLMQYAGDRFTFTPNAARNITVVMTEVGHIDRVVIEILGNTEVTGKLRAESVLYLNANKILTGEFLPHIIPFISHAGRLREDCLPLQYTMISNDGIRYEVVPAITDESLGHYHKLLVDKNSSGGTTDVMIGNDVVYYQSDDQNNTYFIYHAHGVPSGVVQSSDSVGLLNWQNNVFSSGLTSSAHTHNIIYPIIGNAKTIYAIKEDIDGNIYVGTSDGFMIIPSSPSYQFVVNGLSFYFYGNDLWNLFEQAKMQYEKETENPFTVTEEIYKPQIDSAASVLINDGDSVLVTGTAYPDRQTDTVMIKRVSSFLMPDFGYIQTKNIGENLETETVIGTVVVQQEYASGKKIVVERDYNNTPVWSIDLNTVISGEQNYIGSSISTDVFVAGSDLVAKASGLNRTPYQSWSVTNMPFPINVIRKVIKDPEGNYWVCSDNGILVSRYYASGNIFQITNPPLGNPDVQDVLNGELGSVYCASSSGIFNTKNGGKSWNKLFDVLGGFRQITRDKTLDKSSTVNEHYHLFDVNNNGDGFLKESIGIGVKHVHVVKSWNILDTMGHTHTMVVTIYAIDNSKIIWKSIDNGANWEKYGLLPSGECGEIFAAFGSLFVSQDDGLYKSQNGNEWSKVLNNKSYSYEWSYDMSELFIGSDNILYGTLDGNSFVEVYSFDGMPRSVLISNETKQYFGYAYSNHSQSFHFKNIVLNSGKLTALVDFERWLAQGGGWNNSNLYDVYINYKRVLSTKYNEDKQNVFGYHFNVIPNEGMIDFSAETLLIKPISIYDDNIETANASGFSIGDMILIMSNSASMYATIVSINTNNLSLGSRSTVSVSLPASVKKISYLDGNSSVKINVYNSLLSNIGVLTHEQVEDGLSYYSDGRPYKFNDTYLSNLLQLTQATRYVYPEINSRFINSLFYDFRYSWNPLDPYSIYKYIDVLTSEIYNQKFYDNDFIGKWAKSINRILVGFGAFNGHILVATDIGVFIAELTQSFEANWFYVNNMPFAVYDLMIFGDDILFAATSNGTYYTTDLKTWTLETNPAIAYPSYALRLRWFDKEVVIVPSHTATFIPNTNATGTITSMGTPYKNLRVNQGIKITGAGDKNGNYIIQEVGDNGGGFGSQMVVVPSFDGIVETRTGVVITMGSWWGQWNGDINTSNPNLTNTLLVGGENHISYNDGGDASSWHESSFGTASRFVSRKFFPLSNGRILLAATGSTSINPTNYLLKSDDIGKTWDIFRSFTEINGNIISSSVSDFNNTVLKIQYTKPLNQAYVNGILDQQDIAVFKENSTIAIFRGKVVWNEKRDGSDTITIFGNDLYRLIDVKTNYVFIVYPAKVNTMTETEKNTLLFGTNRGIYYDVNTVIANIYPEGTIVDVGYNGIVQKIDISGVIISMGVDQVTGNSLFSVTTDTAIRARDLVGRDLYVTDTNPVEKYKIVVNNSVSPGDEFVLEIDAKNIPSSYIGKRIRISGSSSRVYVNFNMPVSDNQFNGGTLYVSSNKYANLGNSYSIVTSGTNYVDLNVVLVPATTLVSENGESITSSANTSSSSRNLQVGQSVRLIDSSKKLTLWVTLNRDAKENSLQGLSFVVDNLMGDRVISDSTVYSNWKNSITLNTDNVLNYIIGDSFVLKGAMFEQLSGFSHLTTSLESGHYHGTEMVNAMITGEVQSFSNVNASYVDINVINTQNFNTPLVQLQGDLLEDAQIVFTTPQNINLRYVSDVISHTPTSIRVRIKSSSYWNFLSADPLKVSSGWNWEIDGTNYGYTDGITYDDFDVLTSGITETANRGSNTVKVMSTSGMNSGDKIKIQDSTLSFEINYISTVVDATTLNVQRSLSRTYFDKNNPQIKVLRDVFPNTHIHQIRNNEVQNVLIDAYLEKGYPSEHSHRILPLISDVSVLLNQDSNKILSFGSGSIIWSSVDNGDTWQEVVDLNDFLEGSSEVQGVSDAILNNNKLIVGATNGSLFVQTSNKDMIIALNNPI